MSRDDGKFFRFLTQPAEWASDLADLIALVRRFGTTEASPTWPSHALFGPMRGVDWGYFCYKHFDHHLRQFEQ